MTPCARSSVGRAGLLYSQGRGIEALRAHQKEHLVIFLNKFQGLDQKIKRLFLIDNDPACSMSESVLVR